MNRLAGVVALAIVLPLTGCATGGGDGGDGRECLTVHPDVLASIAEASTGAAITPVAGAAVKSATFTDAYIVAMTFAVDGAEDQVGVWSTTTLEPGPVSVLAVDGFAHQFTSWPNEVGGVELDVTEDGATEAKGCLQ